MTCSSILCLDETPKESWKLFFGDSGHFLRVDNVDYPTLMNLFKFGFSNVWAWTAVDFQKDIIGWQQLSDTAKRIFLLNNGYQSAMDSGVVGIYNYLAAVTSNTELALCYQYIAQNESIHAASYSYGLAQMFGSEARDKINVVYTDPVVKSRMEDEVDFSDEFIQKVIREQKPDMELVLKTIMAAYFLESIKFPFSFLTTWVINRVHQNAIQGFSLLLKLIAQDELDFHVPTNANVIKILKREERQGAKPWFDSGWFEETAVAYAKKVAEAEMKWAEYLLQEGELPGLSLDVTKHFIKYMTDKALRLIGYSPIYNENKSDIIVWYNEYRDINNQNASLQETSNISYNKGIMKRDLLANLDKLRKVANIQY